MTPDDPLRRVDALMELIATAHTVSFAWHRHIIDLDRDDERTRGLLGDSARIAVHEAPEVVRRVRAALLDATIGRLLDPAAADATRDDPAVTAAEAALLAMFRRQQEIVDELSARAEREGRD